MRPNPTLIPLLFELSRGRYRGPDGLATHSRPDDHTASQSSGPSSVYIQSLCSLASSDSLRAFTRHLDSCPYPTSPFSFNCLFLRHPTTRYAPALSRQYASVAPTVTRNLDNPTCCGIILQVIHQWLMLV